MLDVWFFFFLICTIASFAFGMFTRSTAFVLLGSVMLMGAGLVLSTEGITMPSAYSIDANATFVDTNYSQWKGAACSSAALLPIGVSQCHTDLSLVVLSLVFLYGGLIALLACFVLIWIWARRR